MRPNSYLQPMQLRGRINRAQPKGLPIINLGFNELPYPPLPAVRDALAAASGNAQSYGSPYCDDLRDALADLHGLDADHIICGNGSEELLDVIARCFARPGDDILISQFGYIQFALTANRVGATLIKAPETNLTTDVDALLTAVTERTKIVFLANPNNPTGTMIPVTELARLADGVRPEIVLVLDLAYGEFAAPDYCAQVHQLVGKHANIAVTRTFSKAYGLAGVRAGWCHGPDWMIPVLYAARGMGTVNAMAQAGALAGLSLQTEIKSRISETMMERDRVRAALEELNFDVAPSAANFVMVRAPEADVETTEALVEHLFEDAGFIVNRTREDGLQSYFRFSMGQPKQNTQLLESISRFQNARQ